MEEGILRSNDSFRSLPTCTQPQKRNDVKDDSSEKAKFFHWSCNEFCMFFLRSKCFATYVFGISVSFDYSSPWNLVLCRFWQTACVWSRFLVELLSSGLISEAVHLRGFLIICFRRYLPGSIIFGGQVCSLSQRLFLNLQTVLQYTKLFPFFRYAIDSHKYISNFTSLLKVRYIYYYNVF